jgi:hypothetical protein
MISGQALEGAFESYVTNAGTGSYTIESSTGQAPTNIVIQNGSISQTTVGYGTITNSIGSPISIQLDPSGCSQP